MKYIRTKGNVMALKKYDEARNRATELGLTVSLKIIKQADNIEELCDGLIVEEKDNTSNWFVMEMEEFKELDKEERLYRLKDWSFNAFIKTDKGLIYVSKMNEKGELELI